MHKITGAPIIEQLQIPSPPSFHSLRPPLDSFKSSLTRHVTELARFLVDVCQPPPPSFPSVIPIEQPRSKEYFFRQNRPTPVARSTKYSTSPERVYPGKNQSIRSLADRRNIYPAVGSRRFTSPVRATLTSRAINLSTPQGSGRAYTPSYTLLRYSMVLAATDVWIKAWLRGGRGEGEGGSCKKER